MTIELDILWDDWKARNSASNIVSNEYSKSVHELINPWTITKKHNQEWRDEVSKEIKKYRWWRDEYRVDHSNASREQESIQEDLLAIEHEERSFKRSRWWKFLSMLESYGIRKNTIISNFQNDTNVLADMEAAYQEEKSRAKKRAASYERLSRKTLSDFKEKASEVPLSIDEKKKLLKPEILSELSLDEYVFLWKRLHPYFLGHVTRQGFRDHVGGSNHIWGLEEFHEWFTSVLDDDRLLRPPISVHSGLNPHDREAIKTFVENEVLTESVDAEGAKNLLDRILWSSIASAPKYAADTSLHFAKEIIADNTYGWERWNEIFYVFPSDVIASQYDYAFNWTADFREKQHEEKWNDIFVWPSNKDTNAIPLDMWIVFLPEDALVDPNTGSRYAQNQDWWIKSMSENNDNKELVRDVLNKLRDEWGDENISERFMWFMLEQGIEIKDIDITVYQAILSYISFTDKDNIDRQEELLRTTLENTGLLWDYAVNPISSKEYWEGYFERNPDKRPARIVYYQGEPTEAVHSFLIDNNIKMRWDISNISSDSFLGLWDKHVESMKEDKRAQPWYKFLIEEAHKIINEHYSSEQ